MQLDLQLTPAKRIALTTLSERILDHLQQRPNDWTNSGNLAVALGTTSRQIRQAIEHAGAGRISSTSEGYRRTADLSPEEFKLSDRALASRIRKLSDRRSATTRFFHSAPHNN